MCRRIGMSLTAIVLIGFNQAAMPDDPPPKANDAVALVRRLGSSSFVDRESAERQLRALGVSALPALITGTASADAEIAERCKRLRREIRMDEFEAFLSGKKDDVSPAWRSFKELLEDSKESRQLFVEIMSDERRAAQIEKSVNDPALAFQNYEVAIRRATTAAMTAFDQFTGRPASDETGKALKAAMANAVPAAEVATVLWLGRGPIPKEKNDVPASRMLFGAGFAAGMEGQNKAQFRKLFAAWLQRRTDPSALESAMNAALYFALPEAIPAARRVLDDNKAPRTIGQALLVVGHHGNKDDLPAVIGYRNDVRVVGTAIPPGGGPPIGDSQLRDIATAMALKLFGQDFEKHGFESVTYINHQLGPNPAPFRGVTMFKSNDDRGAVLKNAWEWLDSQPKGEPAPPVLRP